MKAQSIADLIGNRSPGTRAQGDLIKTKHAYSLLRRRLAGQAHSMHSASAPKPEPASASVLLDSLPPVLMSAGLEQPLSVNEFVVPPLPLGGDIIPGAGPPRPGLSPLATPLGPGPEQPLLVPSAIPEPGTWATMLLGFGIVGWRLRGGTHATPKLDEA
ncbi:MAG: hypothetical protein NVS1B6_10380 [Steroidobacteraceae bacterium]